MGDWYNKIDLNKCKTFVYGTFRKANNSERNDLKGNSSCEKLDNNREKMNLDFCLNLL